MPDLVLLASHGIGRSPNLQLRHCDTLRFLADLAITRRVFAYQTAMQVEAAVTALNAEGLPGVGDG